MEDEIKRLRKALMYYAHPNAYFATTIFGDSPCGWFIEDGSDVETSWGTEYRMGRRAREALGMQDDIWTDEMGWALFEEGNLDDG